MKNAVFHMKNAALFFRAATCAAALCLSACTAGGVSEALHNKGILPLSDSDPFLGPNIFLSKEMEQSSYLHSFMKSHGAPTAIELIKDSVRPARMIMFYARSKEVYAAAPVDESPVKQWVIRGPYQINWRDNREVQRAQAALKDEPVFFIWGRRYRFPAAQHAQFAKVMPPPLPPPPPPPAPRPKPRRAAPASPVKTAAEPVSTFNPAEFKPLNLDQQALMMAKGFAERADNGDLIHTVAAEGTSLASVAKWYTGSDKNASELAKINNLPEDQPLPKDSRIRVPLRLIKQFKVMPEDFK